IKEEFGDARRSEIVTVAEDIAIEDLIAPQDMVVTFSHGGYVKSQPLADYRAQRRGGRGKMATTMKEDDFIERLFVAHSHDHLLCFSNRGRLYWLKVYEVPAGSRSSRGKRLGKGQRVVCMLAAHDESKSVLAATEHGFGKRTPIGEYPRHGRGGQGVIAIQTSERNGRVVGAVLVDDHDEVMLISTGGVLIRTRVAQIREQGRSTQGVTLISMSEGEKLAGLERIEERELEGNGNGGDGEAAAEPPPAPSGPTVH